MLFHGYAAQAPNAPLVPHSFDPGPMAADEVQIRVTHCGVCHSDVNLVDNDWGFSSYPMVPGHEVAGVVEEVGSSVTHLKPGDRVGVGWQSGACLHCEYCASGHDNLCDESQATCVGRPGGFADRIRVQALYAFALPDALPSSVAAPLFCAGITVYSPLRRFVTSPSMRIGVIGIGGLGHIALQFARAWGCEVTAFTSSTTKKKEALNMGAHQVISSVDPDALKRAAKSLDLILNTTYASLNWPAYIKALRPNGVFCFVGVPSESVTLPVPPLISSTRSIAGSNTGSRAEVAEMLAFAARHGIAAKIEEMPLAEVNTALDRLRKNRSPFRQVLRIPGE